MIQHIITRPGAPDALRFEYDFDARMTAVSRLTVVDGEVQQTEVVEVPSLLRHPAGLQEHWVTAVMDTREFGEPAYVQLRSWDSGEMIRQVRVPFERFGLMGMGVSSDGRRVMIDRCFDDPQGGVENSAGLLNMETGELEGTFGPMISNVTSMVFDATAELMTLIHTDQGSCEVRLYELEEDPGLIAEFGRQQIVTDFETGAVGFVKNGIACWSVKMWSFGGQFGVYDDGDFSTRFLVELPGAVEDDGLAEELEFLLGNSDLAMVSIGDASWCGGVGAIHRVSHVDGAIDSVDLDVDGVVTQLRSHENGLLCITHAGEVAFHAL